MRPTGILSFAVSILVVGCGSTTLAQHSGHAGHSDHKPAQVDGRQIVAFPEPMRTQTLANMRDHLLAIQEIQQALADGAHDRAAEIAERRLGMTSLQSHGAHDVAKFMPEAMQSIGTGMHRSASRFAVEVANAGVTGNLKPALAALADVTRQCVACHASYRMK